jgi:hypothetical protein
LFIFHKLHRWRLILSPARNEERSLVIPNERQMTKLEEESGPALRVEAKSFPLFVMNTLFKLLNCGIHASIRKDLAIEPRRSPDVNYER